MSQQIPINITNLHPEQRPTYLSNSFRSFVSSYSRASMMHMAENVVLSDGGLSDDEEDALSVSSTRPHSVSTAPQEPHEQSPLLHKVSTNHSVMTVADSYHTSPKKSTFMQSVFNSINILLGVGILALPLGFKSAGWAVGLGVFVFCFCLTNYTAKVLIKCLDLNPEAKTYGDIGAYTFGMRGRVFISILFLTELITCSIALVVLLTDGMASLFPGYGLVWLRLISFIILTPTLFLPVRYLSYTSLLGILSVFSLLLVILYDGFTKADAPGSLREPADTYILPNNWFDVPLSFGLIMAGFAGHAVFPTIYHDMDHPKEYRKMVNVTYLTTSMIYLTVAAAGYIMFGSSTMQEITQNLMAIPQYNQTINRLAVYLVALNPIAKYGLTLNPVVLTWQTCLPRRLGKLISIVLTTITMVILVTLLPNFDQVISLLGAFFSFFISGIFPLVCHIKLFRHTMAKSELMINILLLLIASFMALSGTVKSFIK